MKIHDWNDISNLGDKWHLLIGNGFSISINDKFQYKNLLEIVKKNRINKYLLTIELFDKLETSNFEDVLKAIYHAHIIHDGFKIGDFNLTSIESLYKDVRETLIESIRISHIDYQCISYKTSQIANQLLEYKTVFTTNYDLIIYWSVMTNKFMYRDFFWNNNCEFDILNTELHDSSFIPVYYLHGAIHLRENCYGQIYKILNPSNLLIDNEQLQPAFPLFISEGKSDIKMKKIKNNVYLSFCYKKLYSLEGCLVVFGHSLNSDYDGHIINAIKRSKLDTIAISIFSEMSQIDKNYFVATIKKNFMYSNKEIIFFESNSFPLSDLSWNF